jgi:hypothetical protein
MYLGATCIDHGQLAASSGDTCCPGLTPWVYDANSGTPYPIMACWSAGCASAGQWAGPSGVGNHCCTGLANVAGKCAVPSSGGGGGTTYIPPLTPACAGTIICSLPDMAIYAIAGGLVLMLVMSKKKGA